MPDQSGRTITRSNGFLLPLGAAGADTTIVVSQCYLGEWFVKEVGQPSGAAGLLRGVGTLPATGNAAPERRRQAESLAHLVGELE
jgi:hypothetical protein